LLQETTRNVMELAVFSRPITTKLQFDSDIIHFGEEKKILFYRQACFLQVHGLLR